LQSKVIGAGSLIWNVGSFNMCAIEPKPKWKRALSLALRIYAGFCTLLLTAYFALLAWSNFVGEAPRGSEEITLVATYGRYMADEYPKRGDAFLTVATSLGWRSKAVPVLRADVLKYLGKPDFVQGTLDTGEFLYIYHPSGKTNQWEAYVSMSQGRLTEVGFNRAGVNDRSGYQPYPGEAAPNQQGGANGGQPFRSDTNRTSAAAASLRSP
jgi:hypothetical protein